MDNKKMFEDINGKESAKRVWANRLLWVGVGTFIIKFIVDVIDAFCMKEYVLTFPTELWIYIMGAGLAALGFTLAEKKT